MAELILSPIADNIIGGLGSEAAKHISLIWGVEGELEDLKETISTIQAVLLDAEKKQSHNNQVKNWLKRLSTVVFKADDLVDEFNTEALRRQLIMPQNPMANKVRTFFSSSNQLAFRFKMSRRIQGIKKKLASISNDKSFFLEQGRQETTLSARRVRDADFYVRKEDVIGRDKDRSFIIDNLLLESSDQESVSVIAIVGIGGLGKTTLAKSIYNDEQVQKQFMLRIWVCVSDQFDFRLIIKSIIDQAPNGEAISGDMGIELLVKKLREVLGGNRYLLVLDDIWEEDHAMLLKLKDLITSNENAGSRVVITTRSENIAKLLTTQQQPYRLGVLDEDQSWSLFRRVAFQDGSQELYNSSIVQIGKEIVKRCKGIPLAIKTIGNILHGKSLESEWSSLDKEFSKIPYRSEDDMLPTLKLSYDHLPSHLKLCFAYCSLFPKDEKIEVRNLINLWMAQGFLKLTNPSQDQCLEDVGYEWFMTLLEGSFFQDVEVDECGIVEKCKMHDLMHDLAVQVAGEQCTTFVISNGQGNIKETTLHVSFVADTYFGSELSTSLAHAKNIRTTFFSIFEFEESFWDVITSNCKVIRSLALNRSSMKLVSNSIGKLKHLRYLDFSQNSYLKPLPNSITNLVNLQTLKLNHSNLKELPRGFVKLINLRHLELSSCVKLNSLPYKIGELTQLRYLDLSWNHSLLFLPYSMNDLLNLQTLKVNNCSKLKELPRDIGKLINLRHLKISYCDKLEYMPSGLDKLTNLQILSNYVSVKSEERIPEHAGELKELMRLNNLRGKLEVINLSCEKNVAVEYEKAKLKDKQYLRSLTLKWDSKAKMDETEAIVGYEMSLEGLQPHQNIQNLSLINYGGVKLSSWLSSLTNLVELTLNCFVKCEYLVPLNQFKCLKHLRLESLVCLRYISNTNNVSKDLVGSVFPTILPSLELLVLEDLPNLKGWWRETDNHISLPYYLPSLSKLEIRNCPKLTCMPLYPRLEGELKLINTSWKPLEETLRMGMMMSSNVGSVFPTTPSFSPLSKLESLDLFHIGDLECLPDSFKSLACLSRFHIDGCPKLKDLCPGILHLSSLRHLQIRYCEGLGDMLISDDYGFMWQSLNVTLQSLQLCKLTVLPQGIQHLTSLQQLQVDFCDDLTTIPEWIHNLKSLKCLELSDCPNLTSFPEGIRSLTTLNYLDIRECPMLLKRCKRNTGEDWDKISHIQLLILLPDPNEEEENENKKRCNH